MQKTIGLTTVDLETRNRVKEQLDRALLCLRLFKEGPVAYHLVSFEATTFCPLQIPAFGLGDMHIPFGSYRIAATETTALAEHIRDIWNECGSDGKIDMACSRLVDSVMRTKARDRLVDAVIGLEALLLQGDKNELSFRFRLNYALLFDTFDERRVAFGIAKSLYDLRSTFAHGASESSNVKVDGKQMSPMDASLVASGALRALICHFIRHWSLIKQPHFWEEAYFGNRRIPALKSPTEGTAT